MRPEGDGGTADEAAVEGFPDLTAVEAVFVDESKGLSVTVSRVPERVLQEKQDQAERDRLEQQRRAVEDIKRFAHSLTHSLTPRAVHGAVSQEGGGCVVAREPCSAAHAGHGGHPAQAAQGGAAEAVRQGAR